MTPVGQMAAPGGEMGGYTLRMVMFLWHFLHNGAISPPPNPRLIANGPGALFGLLVVRYKWVPFTSGKGIIGGQQHSFMNGRGRGVMAPGFVYTAPP